jgi:hypothetical protein
MMNMNHTNKGTPKAKRRYEEDGDFYIGSVGNGNKISRLLCFRNRLTLAVGASTRFSREEAWRKSRRGNPFLQGVAA